jgi:drug/metabolite transporter (DMT)-like permease
MISIWWFAFGYFACYVPYSALTKGLSDGALGALPRVAGLAILPVSNLASMVGMAAFISAVGWWKHAGRARVCGVSFPWPNRYTFVSGLATATVIATTTLAYTFHGVSIVLMMLLLRGGVLVLAPIVDLLSGRRVRWFSWAALGLSLGALLVTFLAHAGFAITAWAAFDVLCYVGAYFIRLRFMSRLAKAEDENASKRYFVEEQMIASPALVVILTLAALFAPAPLAVPLRHGFSLLTASGATAVVLVVIGLLSQGTGIFGGLVLLDKRENSFCVPVNRASSLLAGTAAAFVVAALWHGKRPTWDELVGAAMLVTAILVLSVPGVLAKRRAAAA